MTTEAGEKKKGDEGDGLLARFSRATSKAPDIPEYPKWPADHPYAYTIGDVEIREAPDLKTGKMVPLIFGLNEWPKPSLKAPSMSPYKPPNKAKDKKKDKMAALSLGMAEAMAEEKKEKENKDKKKKKKKKEPKPCRKIFVSFKVKRVSDIDNVEEQFRIKFHIYFNWLPTYKEYMSFIKTRDDEEQEIYEWEPRWYPHLEFMNQIEPVDPFPRWEEYPDEGKFRMQKLRGFFENLCDDRGIYHPDDRKIPILERAPIETFDSNMAYFIRAKYDVEMLLSEELELQSFPFDCQDLSVIMRENTRDMNISFLPEMRKVHFGSIDPRYSVIDEWDMESARIEFGSSNAGSSRSSTTYPMIILRLKMKRRWPVFMWNIVFMVLCIECLALTQFALDPIDDASDRGGLAITLVLTAVAFLHIVKGALPVLPYLTFLDWYVYSGYLFLVVIMIESAVISVMDVSYDTAVRYDTYFMYACIVYQVLYQVALFCYAMKVRREEALKLVMDSDSIEAEVNLTRPALEFDYTKGDRQGDNKRLLFFKAQKREVDDLATKKPEEMTEDEKKRRKKQMKRSKSMLM